MLGAILNIEQTQDLLRPADRRSDFTLHSLWQYARLVPFAARYGCFFYICRALCHCSGAPVIDPGPFLEFCTLSRANLVELRGRRVQSHAGRVSLQCPTEQHSEHGKLRTVIDRSSPANCASTSRGCHENFKKLRRCRILSCMGNSCALPQKKSQIVAAVHESGGQSGAGRNSDQPVSRASQRNPQQR